MVVQVSELCAPEALHTCSRVPGHHHHPPPPPMVSPLPMAATPRHSPKPVLLRGPAPAADWGKAESDPIVDSRRRLEHNIMSSITGSRHNCEQGQPKPQLGGGAQPTTTTKPQGGGEGHHHKPHPTGGGGGDTMGWGGGGGVWQPCIIHAQIHRRHHGSGECTNFQTTLCNNT